MDSITFHAGVWLLKPAQVAELRQIISSIPDPEFQHTRASAFIREHVDAVELVRTAAAVRAGLLQIPAFPLSQSATTSG